MKFDKQIKFPITVIFEDKTSEIYEDVDDLVCNLEDFDSRVNVDCSVMDSLGREIYLVLRTTIIEEMRLVE